MMSPTLMVLALSVVEVAVVKNPVPAVKRVEDALTVVKSPVTVDDACARKPDCKSESPVEVELPKIVSPPLVVPLPIVVDAKEVSPPLN